MKTVAPRRLGPTIAVALFFLVGLSPLRAGTKEITAINNELATLAPGKTIQTATDAELTEAVRLAFIDSANRKLKPELIAAEALKGAQTATNIGTQLATALVADLATPLADTGLYAKIVDVKRFAGTASKAAATGTGPNATQIPTWASVFIAQALEANRNADAIAIARFASGSPTAQGAIIGGRTLNNDASIDDDDDLVILANNAIFNKLSGAAQQIAQYVGDAADDPPTFTAKLVAAGTNTKYLAKIVTGVTTSNPTVASEILNQMFVPQGLGDNTASPVYISTVKNSVTLAKNLGLVADIEEVSQLAQEFAKRIGVTMDVNGKPKVVGIKQSSLNSLAKGLVTGLATRATPKGVMENVYRPNRLDEIGEVGGYLLAGIKTLPVFTTNTKANLKGAPNLIIGLMKTIITASAKAYSETAAAANPTKSSKWVVKDPNFQAIAAEDLAGTIALTLRALESSLDPGIYSAIRTVLLSDTIGTKIAGKGKTTFSIDGGLPKTLAQLVHDTLQTIMGDPITDVPTLDAKYEKYENGTVAAYAQGPFNHPTLGVLTEPETDIRSH
jgi:hypothetical protein